MQYSSYLFDSWSVIVFGLQALFFSDVCSPFFLCRHPAFTIPSLLYQRHTVVGGCD